MWLYSFLLPFLIGPAITICVFVIIILFFLFFGFFFFRWVAVPLGRFKKGKN